MVEDVAMGKVCYGCGVLVLVSTEKGEMSVASKEDARKPRVE